MKIDIAEIETGDTVLIKLDIGNLPADAIDDYVGKLLPKFKEAFGSQIFIIPVRECGVDFTIIRNKNREKKPVKKAK